MLRAYTAPQDLLRLLRSILGPLLVEAWLADNVNTISGNADTWLGKIANTALAAPGSGNRPPHAVDGSNFRGRKVVQNAATGSKCLISANLSPALFAVGSRPWLWIVGRMVTIGSGNNTWIEIVDNPVTRAQPVMFTLSNALSVQDGVTTTSVAAYTDTTVHQYAVGYSPTGAIQLIKDTAVLTSSGSGLSLLNSGGTKLSVGGAFNGTSTADIMIASVLALKSQPPAGQQAALLAIDKATWGF